MIWPLEYTRYFVCIQTEPTRIMTKRTVDPPKGIYEVFAHAQKTSHVTLLTDSLTRLCRGVSHTRETGTITGQGCMGDWSGTDISAQP